MHYIYMIALCEKRPEIKVIILWKSCYRKVAMSVSWVNHIFLFTNQWEPVETNNKKMHTSQVLGKASPMIVFYLDNCK